MDFGPVLDRIGYDGPLEATTAVLDGLHRSWVLTVPFENLDIHLGRPILLEERRFFDKIVRDRRGGFCFEMNGLFAALLRAIGFDVTLLAARVFGADSAPGREFAHLCLHVNTPAGRYLADVGFGDAFARPLVLEPGLEQAIEGSRYRIVTDDSGLLMQQQNAEHQWQSRYAFTLMSRQMSDFAFMCGDFQTNPESAFRKRVMCTRMTPTGRLTLAGTKLIVTERGERRESMIPDVESFTHLMHDRFGIDLPRDAIARLWQASAVEQA